MGQDRGGSQGHRPADQQAQARDRVDGTFGDGPEAPAARIPSASHECVDAEGEAGKSHDGEQGSRCQDHTPSLHRVGLALVPDRCLVNLARAQRPLKRPIPHIFSPPNAVLASSFVPVSLT